MAWCFLLSWKVLDGIPDGACSRVIAHDDAEEVVGDGAIDPGEHGVVIATPSRGRGHVGGSGVTDDVASVAIANEGDKEEIHLVGVAGALIEAERDQNV
jgi:hypothetical protein